MALLGEIDAVLGWHMNPLTCGVAKFNHRLARELGVPYWPLLSGNARTARHALVSIKPEELPAGVAWAYPSSGRGQRFDLFLHGPCLAADAGWLRMAEVVYAANPSIARRLAPMRADIRPLWCPSLLESPEGEEEGWRLMTFGMAQKGRREGTWRHLRRLLDGVRYSIDLACSVHEGISWAEAWTDRERFMRGIFGSHVRVLGFLSDALLMRELRGAAAIVLVYDEGVRDNNTSFWAAMETERVILTTIDQGSPREAVEDEHVHDIDSLTTWPSLEGRPRRPTTERTWGCLLGAMELTAGVSVARSGS